MATSLAQQQCQACRSDSQPLPTEEITRLMPSIPHWEALQVDNVDRLHRDYRFGSFREAFDFATKVAELADSQDHHPLIEIEWGRAGVSWWTHKIQGLHLNDFIMAAKTDLLAAFGAHDG